AERIEEMKALHEADPEGYIYDGHIVPGKGHWMDWEDDAAVPWMAQFKRSPYPKRIVWQQEEVLQNSFYWITAPADELQRGKKVIADIVGNSIDISQCDYSKLALSLCDKMLDLDMPVKVTSKGKTLFEGIVKRELSTLRSTLYERNDPSYIFPAQIEIKCGD
ncbi:MAG: alpha/beta hydrolase, partial [Prevotella sp.]|nr:alpha/beta hydrolase [Prevotella sp.]